MAADAAVQTYGCDRCGHSKEVHGESLECPGRGLYSRAVWRDSLRWVDDGHTITAVVHHGHVSPRLIHPERCTPAFCMCQGEEYIERDPLPDCESCHGTGHDPTIPCWLQHVVEELGVEFWEQTEWAMEIPLGPPTPILWHGDWDSFEWRPKTAAPPSFDARKDQT